MLLVMRKLITAQLNVVLGFQKHLFLSVINNLILQWGTYKESTGESDIKYFPIAFPNKLLYAHSVDLDNPNSYRSTKICWIYADVTYGFLLGQGADYSPINTNKCIFIGY